MKLLWWVKLMANKVKPSNLGAAISHELTNYGAEILSKVDEVSKTAVKALEKETKATAPKKTGNFRKSISSKLKEKTLFSSTYVWYVKAPYYRLTHLLVHGHALPDGSRTKGNPFLENALNHVLGEFERDLKEAISSDK